MSTALIAMPVDAGASDAADAASLDGTYGIVIDDADMDLIMGSLGELIPLLGDPEEDIMVAIISSVLGMFAEEDFPTGLYQMIADSLTDSDSEEDRVVNVDDSTLDTEMFTGIVLESRGDSDRFTLDVFVAMESAANTTASISLVEDPNTVGDIEASADVACAINGYVVIEKVGESYSVTDLKAVVALGGTASFNVSGDLFQGAPLTEFEAEPSILLNIDYIGEGFDVEDGDMEFCVSIVGVSNLGSEMAMIAEGSLDIDPVFREVEDLELDANAVDELVGVLAMGEAGSNSILDEAIEGLISELADDKQKIVKDIIGAVFGDDGLSIGGGEKSMVYSKAESIIGNVKTQIMNRENTVKVFDPASSLVVPVATLKVKSGDRIPAGLESLEALVNPGDGRVFIGWQYATPESDGGLDIDDDLHLASGIYADVCVVPYYASIVESIESATDPGTYYVSSAMGSVDMSLLAEGSTWVFGAPMEANDYVESLDWVFRLGVRPAVDVDLGVLVGGLSEDIVFPAGVDTAGAIQLDFNHSGALDNTMLSLKLATGGGEYALWHIEADNRARLVDPAVIFDGSGRGAVKVDTFSSYVLTKGSLLNGAFESEADDDGDSKSNVVLYVGIGAGVVVLAGVAVFFIRRG